MGEKILLLVVFQLLIVIINVLSEKSKQVSTDILRKHITSGEKIGRFRDFLHLRTNIFGYQPEVKEQMGFPVSIRAETNCSAGNLNSYKIGGKWACP